ncbi:hypothetical protein CTTA_0290 [Comamonas testosteroni]|uniref:Uncharacterized protein n=1 Tax=Comamonas testosteroni TaxID=285 RepID=A0A5A7M990_COMTE|nr:hypothetical protein CTTA_0290 [Comamonas testosteroni]
MTQLLQLETGKRLRLEQCKVRGTEEAPPRTEGVVPLPMQRIKRGGSGKAAQGEPIVDKRQRRQR